MHKITFRYKNTTHEAFVRKFSDKRLKWYLIKLHDGLNFVIASAAAHTINSEALWLQEKIPGEIIHPTEFIQAVGSGLEAAGLNS